MFFDSLLQKTMLPRRVTAVLLTCCTYFSPLLLPDTSSGDAAAQAASQSRPSSRRMASGHHPSHAPVKAGAAPVRVPAVKTAVRAQLPVERVYSNDFPIPVHTWSSPNSKPQALVVGFHGGVMHARSYRPLGEKLAAQNYEFVSFDMRGFGEWFRGLYGEKRDRTFNFKRTKADIRAIVCALRAKHPGIPIYFLGESLGANLAITMATEHPDVADGLILVSPYSKPKLFVYPHMAAHAVQIAVNPFSQLSMRPYLRRRLSHNRQWAEEAIVDPLARDSQSIFELVNSMSVNVAGRRDARELRADMPVLMMIGSADRLLSQKASGLMFARMPVSDKRLIVLQNHGHLIVETPHVRPEVVSGLTEWLGEQSNRHKLALRSSR